MNKRSIFTPIILFGMFAVFGSSAFAQTTLSDKDSRALQNIITVLNLNEEQKIASTEIFNRYAVEISQVENKKLELQRTSDDENLLSTQLLVMNQEMKDLREMRDLEIESILSPLQAQVYQEKIKPEKPQVLHFGIHDRAKCGVCVR